MHPFFTLRRMCSLVLTAIIVFTGCTRITSTDVGAGLIPAIDGVLTKDTLLDVITDTFDDADSVRIYSSDNMVVGAINNDPLFGKSRASMFFELKPGFFPFFIAGHKDSLKVDSAVLCLSFRGVFGDSLNPMTLRVSEIDLNTPLNILYSYPANYPFTPPVNTAASLAPAKIIDIRRLADSVNNRFEATNYQVRIRLNQSVADRFLKTYDSTTAYRSDSAFKKYFGGFALTADVGGGVNALLKINLADTNTKLQLYYNTASTGATSRDTNVAKFVFTSGFCAFANQVTRDRSGSQVTAHITTTSKPDSLVYIQTAPGTYVRVRVPGLQSLANRIIHRAELIAEQVPDDANPVIDKYMYAPRYLLLTYYDSVTKTKRNIPNDYVIGQDGNPNISAFGGFRVDKSINGIDGIASYNFDLSRYVQGVVTRKDTSFTLRLSAPGNDSLSYAPPYPVTGATRSVFYMSPSIGNNVGDGRVRLGGGTHSRYRMRLRVIFSRI